MARRVALVLGSGGARGYAQIGAIQVLHERGYTISGVAGTSMGAVIGGLQAADAVADDEVLVSGPRVLTPEHRAVLAVNERLPGENALAERFEVIYIIPIVIKMKTVDLVCKVSGDPQAVISLIKNDIFQIIRTKNSI